MMRRRRRRRRRMVVGLDSFSLVWLLMHHVMIDWLIDMIDWYWVGYCDSTMVKWWYQLGNTMVLWCVVWYWLIAHVTPTIPCWNHGACPKTWYFHSYLSKILKYCCCTCTKIVVFAIVCPKYYSIVMVYVQKHGIAPSILQYCHGTCPKTWYCSKYTTVLSWYMSKNMVLLQVYYSIAMVHVQKHGIAPSILQYCQDTCPKTWNTHWPLY